MFVGDVIELEKRIRGSHHVLIVNLVEKEVATKSGCHDEVVALDGKVCPAIGRLLKREADNMLHKARKTTHINTEDVPHWSSRAKDSLDAFRDACEHLGFDSDLTTIYPARHGAASRDLMLGTRQTQGVTLCGFWAG